MSTGRERRHSIFRGAATAAICCLAACGGCRSGSWPSKPSWMAFGQKAPADGGLSAQPALAGDVQKPSATAKPYPTTSTPDGYSLPDATMQASAAPGAAPAAVTYGVTPPPAATTAAAGGPATTIAPQVGPYASASPPPPSVENPLDAQPAPAWTPAPLASAAPAAGHQPPAADPLPQVSTAPPPWAAQAASEPTPTAAPPQRYADARASSPAWTPSAIEPASAAAAGPGAASRFTSGGVSPAAASLAPATPPFSAPPAELQPAAAAPAVPAPAVPSRRPDPGYRPGGTSSYRSARSSLAAEVPTGVQPVSFEAEVPGGN